MGSQPLYMNSTFLHWMEINPHYLNIIMVLSIQDIGVQNSKV